MRLVGPEQTDSGVIRLKKEQIYFSSIIHMWIINTEMINQLSQEAINGFVI